jgi:hypothetical protein
MIDHTQYTTQSDTQSAYRLLALCARGEGFPAFYDTLREATQRFDQWELLPPLAEENRMAPLLYHHLQQAGVSIPPKVKLSLQGMVLRNRVIVQTYMSALAEILAAFESAGIMVVVLKGIAVAVLAYADPTLRPLTDLDLLIDSAEMDRAAALLIKLGFAKINAPMGADGSPRFISLSRTEANKITVNVDLQPHHDQDSASAFWTPIEHSMAGYNGPRQPFTCLSATGFTFGREEMLIHLSRHFARHLLKGSPEKPMRLIWLADMVSYTERYTDLLDWNALHHMDSRLIGRLAIFYTLTPRPDTLPNSVPIPLAKVKLPDVMTLYYEGWPHRAFTDARQIGVLRYMQHTLYAPQWWLALYYGAYNALAMTRLHHLWNVLRFAIQRVIKR